QMPGKSKVVSSRPGNKQRFERPSPPPCADLRGGCFDPINHFTCSLWFYQLTWFSRPVGGWKWTWRPKWKSVSRAKACIERFQPLPVSVSPGRHRCDRRTKSNEDRHGIADGERQIDAALASEVRFQSGQGGDGSAQGRTFLGLEAFQRAIQDRGQDF